MGARILSFLLGVMLSGIGWAIVDPKGPAGVKLPALDLGMFEGHRAFIGWGLLALGIAALLSSVLPKGRGPKGGKRRSPTLVDFDALPEATDVAADLGARAVTHEVSTWRFVIKLKRLNFRLLLDQALDVADQAHVIARHQRDRQTRCPSAPGAADAVHIVFGVERHIEIEHRRQIGDVQAAGRHIGGHQHLHLAALEGFE